MSMGIGRDCMKLKLRSVGTSTGLVLPKEMLVRLRAKKDDTLFAIETPAGYLLTPYDPEVETQLDLGRGFMSKYRSVFRALAK
jgi:putative addiction module antidote